MWLLSTENLRLVYFHTPDVVPGGYAVLSHVWQDPEQSFADIQLFISRGVALCDPLVSVKIKETCRIAYGHGYEWAWIDACCIDKSSSAELSEAINSMFEWYSKARICYAFLYDVPPHSNIRAPKSAFRRSKWFTRGWTLQELNRSSDVSGVDIEVLTFTRDVTNDEAYSLMGIFGVHMSTIYGEGRAAFRRLQEEILKHTNDHTLFAWGEMLHAVLPGLVTDTQSPTNYLFAPSPSAFKNSAHMSPAAPSVAATAMTTFFADSTVVRYDTLDFTITGAGVRCQLPIADGGSYAVAILDCQNRDRHVVGLLLHRRAEDGGRLPRYHVGASFAEDAALLSGAARPSILTPRSIQGYRLLLIHSFTTAVLSELNHYFPTRMATTPSSQTTCQIKEFYVMHFLPRSAHPWLGLHVAEPNEFFAPTWVDVEPGRYGFHQVGQSDSPVLLGQESYTLSFSHNSRGEDFTILLGRCKVHPFASVSIEHAKPISVPRWESMDAEWLLGLRQRATDPRAECSGPGRVGGDARAHRSPAVSHDCPEDHIRFWDNATKHFGDEDRRVQLSFSRWPDPDSYCLDIRLCGRIYETLLDGSTRQ
ncbi:heterokaryon incompatibility protein-domain-containing protein [Cerioporus squamosus]|nr:heterokaryon incompatibility protein-domain-containing protein [Cerioporus squamosus]